MRIPPGAWITGNQRANQLIQPAIQVPHPIFSKYCTCSVIPLILLLLLLLLLVLIMVLLPWALASFMASLLQFLIPNPINQMFSKYLFIYSSYSSTATIAKLWFKCTPKYACVIFSPRRLPNHGALTLTTWFTVQVINTLKYHVFAPIGRFQLKFTFIFHRPSIYTMCDIRMNIRCG